MKTIQYSNLRYEPEPLKMPLRAYIEVGLELLGWAAIIIGTLILAWSL